MAAPVRVPGPTAAGLWYDLVAHRDPLTTLRRVAGDYPQIARLHLGTTRAYLFNDPQLVTALLVTWGRMTRKGRMHERIRDVLGDGLLTSEGPNHARHRRIIQPSMHGDRLATYYPVIVQAGAAQAQRWRPGEQRDLAADMSAVTLSVIGRVLFGTDLAEQSAPIADCLRDLLRGAGRHLLPGGDLWLSMPTRAGRRRMRAAARLDRIVQDLAARDGDALVPRLARQLPADQVRDEAMTLLLAGHETTATALTWTWWLLDRHPDVARWWHEELDRCATITDPDRLPRTRAVLAESLRLFPPSWLLGRRLTAPVRAAGYALPAGALCAASQWTMHRDPRFWHRPHEYAPGRWLAGETFDEAAPGQPRGAYFPFGMGARGCVGRGFARAEATLLLAILGQQWAPAVVPDVWPTPVPGVTLRPRHGLPAVLYRRGRAH